MLVLIYNEINSILHKCTNIWRIHFPLLLQPHVLICLHLSSGCLVLNFLRKQRTYVNMSEVLFTNRGSTQGCILSPLLFILYTNSFKLDTEGSYLVLITALLSFLQSFGTSYGSAPIFVDWCNKNTLELNIYKDKINDCRL